MIALMLGGVAPEAYMYVIRTIIAATTSDVTIAMDSM
jgi:hypothetical protein